MNKPVNPLWVGIAVVGVTLIAALASTGWDFALFGKLLIDPKVAMFLVVSLLLVIWLVVRYEPNSKVRKFVDKSHFFPVLVGLVAIVELLLFLVNFFATR